MKVIEKIQEAANTDKVVFSFEFFPPKTEDGVENLFERMERMVAHNPSFCDITWGAGGSTADLTLEIVKRMQNMVCVESMMHLTCTNMPVEKIDHALDTIKSNGIQNVLALRGDPPHGQDKFVQVEGGFACALDLVKHMRAKYGDYFGITVAGYPEAHPDVIPANGIATQEIYENDLAYLKKKVDAGADLIVTQLFYDTDIFLKFVNDCRQIGINCPIVPGIMPINNYKGFLRMTGFCKTKIPEEIMAALEPIKDNEEAVKAYGIHLGTEMCKKILATGIKTLHLYTLNREKQRQRERMAEIEKVKKRREERAIEKAQREEELQLLARERARAEFQDWEKKEEEFHFDQSKVRTEIRLRQGRVKPIDVLIKQLEPSGEFDVEIDEPYVVFKGLGIKEMEELQEDIKLHIDLDRETPLHIQYWEALLVVCNWELGEARKKEAMDKARVRGEELPAELVVEERGLHSSIETDVKSLLEGKGYGELEALQSQIESQMRSGTAKVVEYWEAVLKRLQIYKAKACLREIHAKMLRKHLEHLEKPLESRDVEVEETLRTDEEDVGDEQNDARAMSPVPFLNEEGKEKEEVEEEEEEDDEEADSYSPVLMHGDDKEEAVDPEEDRAILERKRMAVLEERRAQDKILQPTPAEDNFEKKAFKTMGAMEEGDAVFGSNEEINLDSQVYWWHDKYRPRKPKYFNRVHTGYEWNKYNQTHYDHDNPPPKIVQGYKFNIFYPDLVDKARAPTYVIENDGDSADTCIIKFHAGPPYEDIAFRIVNREWEYSHKKGFKCIFDRGILHLYFNFKRYRYRR